MIVSFQVRNLFSVTSVEETSHRYRLLYYSDLTHVIFIGNVILRFIQLLILFYRLGIYRHICGDILERNRTSVSYVAKGKMTPL